MIITLLVVVLAFVGFGLVVLNALQNVLKSVGGYSSNIVQLGKDSLQQLEAWHIPVDGKELLFDNINDPYQMKNLADDAASKDLLNELREKMLEKMAGLNDSFETNSFYKENWISEDRLILKNAINN